MKRSNVNNCENIGNTPNLNIVKGDWWKRDFCYSILSLILFPLPLVLHSICSLVSLNDLIPHIIQYNQIPNTNIVFILCSEVVKLLVTFILFPSNHLLDPLSTAVGSKLNNSKLPVSRRDRDRDVSSSRSGGLYAKAVELWKSLWNFALACILCHFIIILFGAPVLESSLLTLQFSVILVSLTFFPLCLALKPSSILSDVAYISVWNTQHNALHLAKWRLLFTLLGAMFGAVFIPLDWDRPWQKWPITCLTFSMIAYVVFNLFFVVYIFGSIYCNNLKSFILNRNSNKMKYF